MIMDHKKVFFIIKSPYHTPGMPINHVLAYNGHMVNATVWVIYSLTHTETQEQTESWDRGLSQLWLQAAVLGEGKRTEEG